MGCGFHQARRRCGVLAAMLVAVGLLTLAGRGAPVQAAVDGPRADPVDVAVSAPATALHGEHFDYTITLTYTGALTAVSPEYTLTDALPANVIFLGWGARPQGLCPSAPASGQGGTLTCVFQFSPLVKTITFTISVEAVATGSVANSVQLSTGATASAATNVTSLPPGSVGVTITGLDKITLSETVAPPRIVYRVVLTYNGPPIAGTVRTSFTDRLPPGMTSPGIANAEGVLKQCKTPVPQPRRGGWISCEVYFTEDNRTRTVDVTVRPTGVTGGATSTVEVATGATASWTTLVEPPPPAPAAPEPLAGPFAAPTATVTETFTPSATEPGAATGAVAKPESESVSVSAATKTVQVALTWSAGSSFDATGFALVPEAKAFARVPSQVAKLRITKKRGRTWLDVRIKGVHAGKLTFKVVAKKLEGRTRVVARIRQSKRG